MDDFKLIRHYIKRKITHKFIDMDIYSRFSNFFEYKHIKDTTFESFSEMMNFLSEILFKKNYYNTYENKLIPGTCLLECLLNKDLCNMQLELDTTKYYPPKYIEKKDLGQRTTEELKNKIRGMIAGEYIEADAYRLAIDFIEKNKNKELYLEEIKSLKNLVNKFKKYNYYVGFLSFIIGLLEDVININNSKFYFYGKIKDAEVSNNIFKNILDTISQLDKHIKIDQTLLNDIGITQEDFKKAFNSDDFKEIIHNKIFDNINDLKDFKGFDSNILISNLKFNDNEDKIKIVNDSRHINKNDLSLLCFTEALIESINYLLLIKIIGQQHSSKKKRIIEKIDNYTYTAKFSYLQLLRQIRYFAENKPKANYIFIIFLSHYLDLSKAQAQVLSEKFHMLNKDTHYKVFDSIRENIFYNYRFLKKS